MLCLGGLAYYDIEGMNYETNLHFISNFTDPIENMWIRVQLSEGVLMYVPGGAHTRISLGSEGYLDCLLWLNVCIVYLILRHCLFSLVPISRRNSRPLISPG